MMEFKNMTVLVTGGAGYIGSHTVLCLLQAGAQVRVLDNLCNSSPESLARVARIAGRSAELVVGDVRDEALLQRLLGQGVDAVIHFAGLKAVGESVREPQRYYDVNVGGSLALSRAMAAAGVFKLVFSSSATVYGDPQCVPIDEDQPAGATTNPYGRSKWIVEQMLVDLAAADPRWRMARLRYFNPVGAHASGLIGEDPRGIPNNLLPFIAQVAVGQRPELAIYGQDWPTPDGTGVRDYLHVMDLAEGHLCALQALQTRQGAPVWNLGTGHGASVLEMVRAFEQASGRAVPYRFAPRRDGDIAVCYADPRRAQQELGWQARRGLAEMMADTWRWQSQNPQGFAQG
ncbi:MAG: UDP-glucose 4-epimerase GalE [Limnohabitans sp.]